MPDLYLILMFLEFNHRQCTCNVTLRSVHATIVAVEKECVTDTECVCVFVALGIRHAVRVLLIMLSSVAFLAVQYLPTFS